MDIGNQIRVITVEPADEQVAVEAPAPVPDRKPAAVGSS